MDYMQLSTDKLNNIIDQSNLDFEISNFQYEGYIDLCSKPYSEYLSNSGWYISFDSSNETETVVKSYEDVEWLTYPQDKDANLSELERVLTETLKSEFVSEANKLAKFLISELADDTDW